MNTDNEIKIATAKICQAQPGSELQWFGSPTPVEDATRYLRRAWLDVYHAQIALELEWRKNPAVSSVLENSGYKET